MKHSEIRIGNLVRRKNRNLKVTIDNIHLADEFLPLRLSRSWEKRLGFRFATENKNVKYLNLGSESIYLHRSKDGDKLMIEGNNSSEDYNFIYIDIRFVSQVQNIYYSIVGRELPLWKLCSEEEPPERTTVRVNLYSGEQLSAWREGDLFTVSEGTEIIDSIEIMSWQKE
jgi:hypothetical protein